MNKVYEPYIRARLGTAAHLCEVVVLKLRTLVSPNGPNSILKLQFPPINLLKDNYNVLKTLIR